MTPANIVTLIRIIFIPVFVVAILSPWTDWILDWEDAQIWKPWVAALIFIALSLTDTLDGYLARSRGEVTDLGKFMDPLADKILVCCALLALVELTVLPSWVAMVILAREFIVSGIRMVAATKNVVIAASWYGKAKTCFQMFAIVLFIVKDSPMLSDALPITYEQLYLFSWLIMLIAVFLTILSLLDYFAKSRELLGFKKKDTTSVESTAQEPLEVSDEELDTLAGQVILAARDSGLKIATAESCTGGLVSATLTNVAGASEALEGAVVSYSNDVKRMELGVEAAVLDTYGAVSEQTAKQMCEGVKQALKVDVAVSITGIAGPGGAVEGKPVGTVCFGLADKSGNTKCETCHFQGNREQIRKQSVYKALNLFVQGLE